MRAIQILEVVEKTDGLGFPYKMLSVELSNSDQPGVSNRTEISIATLYFFLSVTDGRKMQAHEKLVGKTYEVA